ncbi:MAG: winged helix-turn-helix transcriptional regulator [Spirochaetales bacterium]|nr:winged helix-turn-helix transcriptional regulator [Spirochaetales bacterium]
MESQTFHTEEKELDVLEKIYESNEIIRQRDLAEILGLSLGMTNAILKRLVQKGLLTIKKVNNRNIRYIVSSAGVEAITRRSYRFFKRTIKNVVYYREAIERLILNIKKSGYTGVVLIGKSDLDFILEHACRRSGLSLVKKPESFEGRLFRLYSETYIIDEESLEESGRDVAFLQQVLM